MNEDELRGALKDVMVASSPPPPMEPSAALAVARHAHRRHRATWTGVATAAAVAAVAVGAVLVPGFSGGQDNRGGAVVAGQGASSAVPGQPSATTTGSPTAPPSTEVAGTIPSDAISTGNTDRPWPSGQSDRTARSGPHFDQGIRLLDALSEMVPAGYAVASEQQAKNKYSGESLSQHQSQFSDWTKDGGEIWEYQASVGVTKTDNGGNGVGELFTQVYTANNTLPTDPCALAKRLWGLGGTCQVTAVGDKQVGVASGSERDGAFDQWAAYRHADGTVVFVGQAKKHPQSDAPGLDALPLSTAQLAELTTDARLKVR